MQHLTKRQAAMKAAGVGMAAVIGGCSPASTPRRPPPGPLRSTLAPHDQALTFARVRTPSGMTTLLVTAEEAEAVEGVAIGAAFGRPDADPLAVLASVGRASIRNALNRMPRSRHARANLMGAGGHRTEHIAVGALPRGAAILTGTPAGVIYRPPSLADRLRGALAHAAGGFLSQPSLVDQVIEDFLRRAEASRAFMHPGDVVEHSSSHLGGIRIDVV